LHDVHPSEPHLASSARQGFLLVPCRATPLAPLQLARPPSKSLRSVVFPARKLLGAQAAPPPRRHPSGPLCCARHAPDNGLTLQAPQQRRFVQGIRTKSRFELAASPAMFVPITLPRLCSIM